MMFSRENIFQKCDETSWKQKKKTFFIKFRGKRAVPPLCRCMYIDSSTICLCMYHLFGSQRFAYVSYKKFTFFLLRTHSRKMRYKNHLSYSLLLTLLLRFRTWFIQHKVSKNIIFRFPDAKSKWHFFILCIYICVVCL